MGSTLAMKWGGSMARRLFVLYLLITLGPLVVAAAAFTLRDLLSRRRPDPSESNGHAEAEALEHTVEEVQAI